MKGQRILTSMLALALTLTLAAGLSLAEEPASSPYQGEGRVGVGLAPLGTAFTYQGQLIQSGSPVNGTCDFQFSLWDAASGGTQIGSTQTALGVAVSNGLFSVQLDFGSAAFTGDARWLQIAVRYPAGSGSYTTLTPRQELTATPYALYAKSAPWSGLSGVPAGFADGVDNDTTYTAGTGLTLAGNQFSLSSTYRLPQTCSNGQVAKWSGSVWVCGNDETGPGGDYWSLTGNAGTNPTTNFLGTTDNQPLEMRVNNQRVWRAEPNVASPNLIGGYSGNSVTAGVYGATIGGGGANGNVNSVTANYGTVGGGRGGTVSGVYATIGGGNSNTASGLDSTIGGGYNNLVTATYGLIGGGYGNEVTDYAATVSGGYNNTASGLYTTIGGGYTNIVTGSYATAGGGYRSTASGYATTVSGGYQNTASNSYATVGGGSNNIASGNSSAIGGGYDNIVTNTYGTIGGGYSNEISGYAATIVGGFNNIASGYDATVGGGRDNTAAGDYSFAAGRQAKANHRGAFVWGDNTTADITSTTDNQFLVRASGGVVFTATSGALLRLQPDATSPNLIGGYSGNSVTPGVYGATIGGGGTVAYGNSVTDNYGTVGGGRNNRAGDNAGTTSDAVHATVGGGWANTASNNYTTIGGGDTNTASGDAATVGGGWRNTASGDAATVGGGYNNIANGNEAIVSGGWSNMASGVAATVSGGYTNTASALYATVGGGEYNSASNTNATVGGGWHNIASGGDATVGGGSYNMASGDWATISGGESGAAIGDWATVGGGKYNYASGNYATIGGGYHNGTNAITATIGGGEYISVTGRAATVAGGSWITATGNYATVGGGWHNKASGYGATVSGGGMPLYMPVGAEALGNTASGDLSTVGGGSLNTASGDYATVSGGYINTANGDYATVPGGSGAAASHYGQMAYANGMFADLGDAQATLYVLRNTTTDATPKDLFLDGSAQRLTIATNSTLNFQILVVARSSGGASAGYHVLGIIENTGGAVAFVGVPIVTTLGEEVPGWSAAVQADDVNNALVIRVTGAAGTTIRWVATIRTAEVAW